MPIYMKLGDIKGESQSEQFRDFFDIFSFSWGVSQTSSHGGGGGGGAGKVQMQDFHFFKPSGKASPKLMLHCCTGRHFPKATVFVTTQGSEREDVYQRYELENVMISSYQTSGDGGSRPTESLSLNFTKITFTQNSMQPDGSIESETNFFDFSRGVGG